MIETHVHEEISIPAGQFNLPGELEIPQNSSSLVLFSHGSGSSRLSPRNQLVARKLRENGIGTFLFDLLAIEEDRVEARFDIALLTKRLLFISHWLLNQPYTKEMNLAYFGASTGAASAMNAAAKMGSGVKAVVSRGGRPDLAMASLPEVKAATLLIVGSLDYEVIELNQQAFEKLNDPKELIIIPGASHLFEEPGKLEEVAGHASKWFSRWCQVLPPLPLPLPDTLEP
jgi:putative phosphoribosyl transferase